MAWILMYHPILDPGQRIRVPEEVVPGHEHCGWVAVADDDSENVTVSDLNFDPPVDPTPAEPVIPAEESAP